MAHHSSASRRGFLKASTAAGVAASLAAQGVLLKTAAGAVNTGTLKVGLIGCGGRGTGAAAQALTADKNVVLTAMGDAFADRVQSSAANLKKQFGDRVQATPETCFVGWDAYQKVIQSGVDVVLLATTPHFRPIHLRAAIEAGKHVFCEKPVAVDAPGVRSVLETAEMAKQKGLSLVSGFCWRYSSPERELFARIHDGQLGDVTAVYGAYNTGLLWHKAREPQQTDMEWHMRNWYYFTWLSGDHLVEQAVHSCDKMCWAMKDQAPLRAIGHGGRQVRTDAAYGNIFDHFEIVYEYPNDARGFLFTRQMASCYNGTVDTIHGSKGVAEINGGANVRQIKGEKPWKYSGEKNDMYQSEHDELFASIRAGKPMNDGVRMTNSTMHAILGRMAAYTGQVITWEKAMASKETLSPEHYAWDAAPPEMKVAIPGRTKFV